MSTHFATRTFEGDWIVIDVEGVGATQARSVKEAGRMARDLVSGMLDVPFDDVTIIWRASTPSPEYVDLVAEVTRWRIRDKTEAYDSPRWWGALGRFRDVADRLMGADVPVAPSPLVQNRVDEVLRRAADEHEAGVEAFASRPEFDAIEGPKGWSAQMAARARSMRDDPEGYAAMVRDISDGAS